LRWSPETPDCWAKKKPLRLSRGLLWTNKPAWYGRARNDQRVRDRIVNGGAPVSPLMHQTICFWIVVSRASYRLGTVACRDAFRLSASP
jgi:hypothetical protein